MPSFENPNEGAGSLDVGLLLAMWARQPTGSSKETLARLKVLIRYAYLIERGPGALVRNLVGQRIYQTGLAAIRDVAWEQRLDPEHLRDLQEWLARHFPTGEGAAEAIRCEYTIRSQALDAIHEGQVPPHIMADTGLPSEFPWLQQFMARHFLHPNRTRRDTAGFHRKLLEQIGGTVADLDAADPAGTLRRARDALLDGSSLLTKLRKPNPIGTILAATGTHADLRMVVFLKGLQTAHAATVSSVALYQYERDHGTLPDNLQALVPTYMKELPRDYFDGRPLRYAKDKRILYSVGEDLEDSGGVEHLSAEVRREYEMDSASRVREVIRFGDAVYALGKPNAGPASPSERADTRRGPATRPPRPRR